MHSTKPQKYYVEGSVRINTECLSGAGMYKRLTLRVDTIYVSLFIEDPKKGLDKKIVEQVVSGFYISDHALVKVGQTYQLYDALTEVGSILVSGSL